MINFSPGPSEIYFTVQDHLKKAFRDGIPSLSHRSKSFEDIFSETTTGLRQLLDIPDGFHIVFVSSATEVWERSIQNLVQEKSFHLVNGAFSKKFYEISKQLQRKAEKIEVADGSGFQMVTVPPGQELIGVTHNETSTGVSMPPSFIRHLGAQNPGSLLVVDAVSSLPYPSFDYGRLDSVYFSVQKGFGLPAGLGVWIYNQRCVDRAMALHAGGQCIGSYNSLLNLTAFANKNQTPQTPNVLGIYLLGKVVQDFLRRGITTLRRETEYKAAVLYQALDKRTDIRPFVTNPEHRSQTVITVDCGSQLEPLTSYLTAKGFFPGEGYGGYKNTHLRIANFPAHSKEQFEALADAIAGFH
ncbi:MAG: aminotransferase class V-fold PLP-dependent enzyme [Cytophagales bacterium]|nr:aminotransferase class V-fold PLP-dependent enzyme [Cytophagales bacterium]